MNNRVLDALRLYLIGEIDFETLENRVIPLAWDARSDDQDLIDQVAVEFSYVKDAVSDEILFRSRMAELAAPKADLVIGPDNSTADDTLRRRETRTAVRTGGNDVNVRVTYGEPATVTNHYLAVQLGR